MEVEEGEVRRGGQEGVDGGMGEWVGVGRGMATEEEGEDQGLSGHCRGDDGPNQSHA